MPTDADSAQIIPHGHRVDAATLRAPRTLDDGTVVYDAILATAGEPLHYAHGVEHPTAEALSDEAHLQSLVGLSVLIDERRHPEGNRVEDGDTRGIRRCGTVVGARWEDESQAVVAELAVHDPRDQAQAREWSAVSEAYAATVDGDRQIRRVPNHVLITSQGRAGSARLRADAQGDRMDAEKLMERLESLMEEMAGIKSELAKAKEAAEEADSRAESAASEADAKVEAAEADAERKVADANERADARAYDLAAEMADLHRRADALEVELPKDAKTLPAMRKALALALDCPTDRADSADAADAWIAAHESVRSRGDSASEAARFAASGRPKAPTSTVTMRF